MSIYVVSVDGTHPITPRHMEFQLTSEADLAQLPTDCAPGSIAYLDDYSKIWNLSNDGTWKAV